MIAAHGLVLVIYASGSGFWKPWGLYPYGSNPAGGELDSRFHWRAYTLSSSGSVLVKDKPVGKRRWLASDELRAAIEGGAA